MNEPLVRWAAGGSLGSWDLNSDSGGRFQQCLRSQGDSISDIMGMAFFNVLEIPCFVLKEQEACVAWHWWGGYVAAPLESLPSQQGILGSKTREGGSFVL